MSITRQYTEVNLGGILLINGLIEEKRQEKASAEREEALMLERQQSQAAELRRQLQSQLLKGSTHSKKPTPRPADTRTGLRGVHRAFGRHEALAPCCEEKSER